MSNAMIRVNDAGLYQVGITRNGINFEPDGEPFTKPGPAVDYARRLDGEAPRPRFDDSAGSLGGGLASGDDRAETEAPDLGQALTLGLADAPAGTCAGCGGPIPPGRRGQHRLTCSPACRERARYRRAAIAAGADTDAETHDLTPSRPAAG